MKPKVPSALAAVVVVAIGLLAAPAALSQSPPAAMAKAAAAAVSQSPAAPVSQASAAAPAQNPSGQPRLDAAAAVSPAAPAGRAGSRDTLDVLIVVAHPDDEAMFAAAVYKITHTLGGNVDLAVVTDGGGGFRYSQLAEPIYGLELTDETIARHHLPAIRKRELMAAGVIMGVRNYFFLDEFDHRYTENVDTVLNHVWEAAHVRARLREIMERQGYDFVFTHLPIPAFHAHHKAATILSLEAAREIDEARRPVVLGSFVGSRSRPGEYPSEFTEHPGYPVTRVRADAPPFIFDRTQALSPDGRLDYQIVVNWVITEHKSQGTMQLLINRGDLERFWIFEANPPGSLERTRALFERLNVPLFPDATDS